MSVAPFGSRPVSVKVCVVVLAVAGVAAASVGGCWTAAPMAQLAASCQPVPALAESVAQRYRLRVPVA